MIFPTSWRGAGCRLVDPGGRPGPGLPGFGAPARQGRAWWMFRNPRRTRGGVSRPAGAGRSQSRRRSAASGRASRSWAWQGITIQVHRSAAAGSRSFWAVQPRTCLNSRKVLKIKSAQERLPPPVHLGRGGAGDRAPWPHRLWVPVAGQVIHPQTDQGALDHGQRAAVVQPGGAASLWHVAGRLWQGGGLSAGAGLRSRRRSARD